MKSKSLTAVVITLSDKGARGERKDESGPWIKSILEKEGIKVPFYKILPDDRKELASFMIKLVDMEHVDLIITTGGTGLSPSDITPEATRDVIEKEVPGFSEIMRIKGYENTPHALLSRGISGTRGETLIINLPGSLKAVKESLSLILPAIPHAIAKLQGDPTDCGR